MLVGNSIQGGRKSSAASITVELINFIKHMDLDDQFRSELKSIYQAMVPVAQELYLSVAGNDPFRSHRTSATINLSWPDFELSENERRLFAVPPTQHQWLAAFIRRHLTKTLPDLVSEDQKKEELQAMKLAWTELRFTRFDSDMDNTLSLDEFAEFLKELQWPVNFMFADKNDDESVSVPELFEYLESGMRR